jgi:regulatory protein
LNDERFVKFFIQGKLRIKKWGKIKLKYELKSRGINYQIIEAFIKDIPDDEYISYFEEFSSNKIKFLKGTVDQKKRSFINYFTYRGWENDLIYQKLRDIN